MPINNIEFKARTENPEAAEKLLLQYHPVFIGEDHQVDTYFHVAHGRLKLREGNIENALIHYQRKNAAGSKSSTIQLYRHTPDANLKAALSAALGVKAVVDKKRRIYFIGNVKFHFDRVEKLGTFIEVEAIDENGSIGAIKLQQQCDHYADLLQVKPTDFIAVSYSDMLL